MLISFQSIDDLTDTHLQHFVGLEPYAVHLWGIELEGPQQTVDRCVGWLDDAERHRAARLVHEQHRRHYLLAHGGLRAVLSRYLGVSPRAISMGHTEAGKPFLIRNAQEHSALMFNLSHSHNRALIAVSKAQEVGVDLESVRSEVDAAGLSERYFAASEHARIAQVREEQRARMFFRHWVAKEAVLKAQGIGLRGLSGCEIVFGQDPLGGDIQVRLDAQFTVPLRARLLSCGEGWEAAVAAQELDVIRQGG